jgi:hypothetical protein
MQWRSLGLVRGKLGPMHTTDPHVAVDRLTELMISLLKELHDMPKKAIDPNWLRTLEEDDTYANVCF